MDYINNPMDFSSRLKLAGNTISMNGINFQKGTIGSSDNTWLNTLHGPTGDCKWYYDLSGSLYVKGEGNMADYTSFSSTPWGMNNRIPNYVEIQKGVTSIGACAFANPSIGEVYISSNAKLKKIGASAFEGTCISNINLPSEITVIGESAFSGCNYLTKAYMPGMIEEIGSYAFSGCKSASLLLTKNLRRIGPGAFMGCEVTSWTDSPVLEKVGEMALSNCSFQKLVLPNSVVSLGHLAFGGKISEIHIGTGLFTAIGTPFATTKSGKLYVNQNNPMPLADDIVDINNVRNWTLYVPSGSKSAYSKAEYWKNFKTIIEDSTLDGDGTEVEGKDDNNDDNNKDFIIPDTYTNNGETYKWIKVESPTIPTFYIMQTELNPDSHFRIGKDIEIGILNTNGDYAVIKSEFRSFLEKIKKETGIQMRAPTAEEWMYAASGGNKSEGYIYSGSDNLDEVGWYKTNSIASLHYFAMKSPNELGLYDMSGNYGEITNNNLNDPAYIDGRIYGGCWNDNAANCKITSYVTQPASGDIPGTKIKNKNAFDSRKYTVRLAFTVPE